MTSSDLEINTEPSYFTTRASIRKLILKEQEGANKKGTNLYKQLASSILNLENEEPQSEDPHKKELLVQVPQVFEFVTYSSESMYLTSFIAKVVVISLRSIFDLIQESQSTHPQLCLKVLRALFGILQNIVPESLMTEPCHVVGRP